VFVTSSLKLPSFEFIYLPFCKQKCVHQKQQSYNFSNVKLNSLFNTFMLYICSVKEQAWGMGDALHDASTTAEGMDHLMVIFANPSPS